ncbi:MAG: peptidoglycan DD-metalloendopeptidase family protein [Alphaproteobacteria bacterium]|nr:peptidoglycan DD-metalloendopeptidase family protein [Alphaproteobacteria bacterium]
MPVQFPPMCWLGTAIAFLLMASMSVFSIEVSAEGRDNRVSRDAIDRETMCGIARGRRCDIDLAVDRGLIETGLTPRFPAGFDCRDIDEAWAISYTHKRDREAYHGGIDMPAPFGTPIVAVASGRVVAKSMGERGHRGIEIILRHSPEDTGLPVWVYTQYAHFDEMPKQQVGQRVQRGEVLGPTGNSGKTGLSGKERRPAIHFAAWFSPSPKFFAGRRKVVPVDGKWLDPLALYRKKPPFDSYSLRVLSEGEKQVSIPIMLEDGTVYPADTKLIWPYRCKSE